MRLGWQARREVGRGGGGERGRTSPSGRPVHWMPPNSMPLVAALERWIRPIASSTCVDRRAYA